ncbi:50S ribosomal protein L33 [Candidatus Nomurabacteria bacterium]|nr:50S ribosomal protein L33 [Candidatus Nomurabacteria bacterium]
MSQDKLVKLKCSETGDIRYTRKNKKTVEKKLELKKYNPRLRKKTVWKETKK